MARRDRLAHSRLDLALASDTWCGASESTWKPIPARSQDRTRSACQAVTRYDRARNVGGRFRCRICELAPVQRGIFRSVWTTANANPPEPIHGEVQRRLTRRLKVGDHLVASPRADSFDQVNRKRILRQPTLPGLP
jgi:hypothetical protein